LLDRLITQSWKVTVGQVALEMTESRLFIGGQNSDNYDPLLLVREEEKLGSFDKVSFCRQSLLKMVSADSTT
jgi:hypothetical protein